MIDHQLLITFLGWLFLFGLHQRTLKKAEICRLKDNITKEVREFFNWIYKKIEETKDEYENLNDKQKQNVSNLIEEEIANKLFIIELYIGYINKYCNTLQISSSWLYRVRDTDVDRMLLNTSDCDSIKQVEYDVVEEIETAYHDYTEQMFSNIYKHLWIEHKDHLTGLIVAGSVLCLYAFVFKCIYL